MSGPCFAHFQMNCKICFPTANTENQSESQNAPEPSSTSPITGGKRTRLAVEFRPLKRKKNAIIDCVIAQQIFRRDFRLTNTFFKSGDVLAWALEPDDPAFRYIYDYVAAGQEHGYGLKVCSILRIVAKAKSLEDTQVDFNHDPKTKDKLRIMLWHGTKKEVIKSILENGLTLPLEVGQMFGPGIYFADRISKSAGYTGVMGAGAKAYLLLCDVLVGNMFESKSARVGQTRPPSSMISSGEFDRIILNDSIKGVGSHIPDPRGSKILDGSVWPLGETILRAESGVTLQYNEYVVYKESQVQPKYLVKVELTNEPHYEVM